MNSALPSLYGIGGSLKITLIVPLNFTKFCKFQIIPCALVKYRVFRVFRLDLKKQVYGVVL